MHIEWKEKNCLHIYLSLIREGTCLISTSKRKKELKKEKTQLKCQYTFGHVQASNKDT